jgi:hypothetical protein
LAERAHPSTDLAGQQACAGQAHEPAAAWARALTGDAIRRQEGTGDMGKQEDRVAEAVGPSLEPGEETFATIEDDRQYHGGHQDTFKVSKDEFGLVTVEKYHIRDDGTAYEDDKPPDHG